MRIGILGSGNVGQTLATALVAKQHDVRLGCRTANNEKAAAWVAKTGARASQGTFADAAAFGELLLNCTQGEFSLAALEAAGADNLRGKVLIDVSNPLDFSKGMPPSLFVSNTDSLGERIQRAFPDVRVVKSLNTVSAPIMVNPGKLHGEPMLFVCGNDAAAKAEVTALLQRDLGWKRVLDLGDITAARGVEAYLLLWLRMWGALKTTDFDLALAQ
jgi:hypothetical protein